jgi:hypothetical protein
MDEVARLKAVAEALAKPIGQHSTDCPCFTCSAWEAVTLAVRYLSALQEGMACDWVEVIPEPEPKPKPAAPKPGKAPPKGAGPYDPGERR